MKTKKIGLVVTIAAMVAGSAMAGTDKWTGGASGNWTNTANWSLGILPTADTARFDNNGEGAIINTAIAGTVNKLELGRNSSGTTLAINSGGSVTINQMRIAAFAGTDSGTININGGALTINGGNHAIGYKGAGVVNLNSGSFSSNDDIALGREGSADGTLNVFGGTLSTVGHLTVGGRLVSGVPTGGTGAVNISAGTATVGDTLRVGIGGNGTLTVSGAGDLTVGTLSVKSASGFSGVANLNGGTVSADKVVIGENGTLNLLSAATLDSYTNMHFSANGLLAWEGDHTADVATLAGDGTYSWGAGIVDITTLTLGVDYDQSFAAGSDYLVSKYDAGTGNTEVWTVIPEPATMSMFGLIGAGMLFVRRRILS